jgi:hypothetical protein
MIKNLLFSIALLCLGITCQAQINVSNTNKSVYMQCFSQDAVGYRLADGVFYYNYSKTTKVSNSADVYTMQMTDKYMLWTEKDVNTPSLYMYDGTTVRKISTTPVNAAEVKITPAYFLWIGKVGTINQIFRYNRSTGIVTQLTNETVNCSNLLITDPLTAAFSFAYAIPTAAKPNFFTLITSTPSNNRRVVYDEYSGYGYVAAGHIFFTRSTGNPQIQQVFRSKTGETGATQVTYNSIHTSLEASSEKYVVTSTYNNSTFESTVRIINAETLGTYFSKTGPSGFYSFKFSGDKFIWTEAIADYELMYFDGRTEFQITNNTTDDYYPFFMNQGNIIWINYGGNGILSHIMHYETSTGITSQIDQPSNYSVYDIQVDGGNILASQYKTNIMECFLYTTSSYKLSSLDFRCDEASKNGTAVFSIEKQLKPGVIGLDFKVTFDPAAVSIGSVEVLNPTDANGNTANVAYTVAGNTITISYYLRSASPGTSIIATGPILGINFVRNASTTYTSNYTAVKLSEVEEGYALGSVKTPGGLTASYNISSDTYVGLLLYGGNTAKPMVHSAANPAAVFQADYACVQQPLTSAVANPGTTGVFRINKNTINSQLQIVKDLPGSYNVACASSNIMTFMNGTDWALAADISRGITTGVTSPLQYIAADVNMDGRVNAADAALISSRSVLKICEYPQTWNYVLQNGFPVPGPNYRPSKDFVFVHENMFTATASRDAVPQVTDCLPMPASQVCPASDALATKYAGIMLGDANLSYWPSNVLTRIGAVNDVVFSSDQNANVVHVSGTGADTLKSLDFRIVLPEGVKVEDVVAANPDVNLNWNAIDSLLLVTSYVDGSSTPEQLFNIILKNGLLNNLSSGDFYINGEPAGFANRIVNGTTDLVKKHVKISPNPNSGRFTLEFREGRSGWITVSDMEGKVVSKTFAAGTSQELNIEEAPAGVYFVKVESDNTTEVYKIVKQ